MSFRLWQILCFMLAVVGATVLIFPYEREMVDIYVQGGDLARARAQLEEILSKKSPGFELLVTAAGLYQLAGEPDRAIEFLGLGLGKKPNNLKALNLMARYLEWNVQPLRAAPFYERILK
ncbi:MAG: tetratricopeptide repeat protein, partial [Desulfovibrionaceae bacterium]|nr:tetratricopeptide repeat protein [Desulfovibrionaceae bacterium]